MASTIPSLESSKILLGEFDTSVLSASANLGLSSGVLVNAGLTFFGASIPTGVDLAGVNIGPPIAASLGFSLNVEGNTNILGTITTTGVIIDNAFSNIFGFTNRVGAKFAAGFNFDTGICTKTAFDIKNCPDLVNVFSATPTINFGEAFGNITGTVGTNFTTQAQLNTKKSFDIPHPTKQGWRLRHICIEGPTADVYVRGKLENSNVIELPDYWRKLVDPETITVNLTPIGVYQELVVETIEWGTKIIVKNNSGSAINCYYTVYGERADTSKNIPEYEGSYYDYPGNNKEYTTSGTSAIVNK